MHERLPLKREDLMRIINHLDVAVWIINIQNNKAFFSNGFLKVFGRSPEEFYNDFDLWEKTIHPDDISVVQKRKSEKQKGEKTKDEYRILTPTGEVRWIQDRGIPFQDEEGNWTIYIGIIIDITDRKKTEAQIIHSANHDDLTGLPNRKCFGEHLNKAIKNAHLNNTQLAILFIDLDQFKMVNDTLGHNKGDQMIKQVGNRISSCVRSQDHVARQGGDEFIILIQHVKANDVDLIAERILRSLDLPFILEGNEIFITASIGISVYPQHGKDAETLIKNADAAMYEVKDNGKNDYSYYSLDIENANNRKLAITNGLHKALENGEFQLYYQPKIDISTESVKGVEALLRWNHPILGFISPMEFIPVAEDTGLIIPIGEWVLHEACRQFKEWESHGIAPKSMCINMSPKQLMDKQLISTITAILNEYNFNPEHLDLEITETVGMHNFEDAIAKLNQLKEIGIKLALDDFGTGYSSLSYLRQFPIDFLKIDRSFINEVLINCQTASIVKSIISIAHTLNLQVIAEGVETEEQLEYLREQKCDYAQGYYISPPVPNNEIEEILRNG
jgi:diguanylate cyclase (GGDEF)-like protein/PAS domain S-box-containing protein